MKMFYPYVIFLFLLFSVGHLHAQMLINGAGATFPYPIYVKWFEAYAKANPKVKINYQSIGSGGGIRQVSQGTVDFGATDTPVTDQQMEENKVPLLHFPTVIGAVVIAYNIPGIPSGLNMTRAALSGIFLGKITKWNDPEIAKANPQLKLPSKSILVIYRSDGSGTTGIFTDYLSKINQEWKGKVGSGPSVKWPVGIGGKGNEGVSGLLKKMPFSIGYISLNYAVENQIAVGKIENRGGVFIAPDLKGVTAAADSFKMDADFRIMITDSKQEDSYPISGLTWFLLPKTGSGEKRKVFLGFLKWMLAEGQSMAPALHYAPLPRSLIILEEEAVAKLH